LTSLWFAVLSVSSDLLATAFSSVRTEVCDGTCFCCAVESFRIVYCAIFWYSNCSCRLTLSVVEMVLQLVCSSCMSMALHAQHIGSPFIYSIQWIWHWLSHTIHMSCHFRFVSLFYHIWCTAVVVPSSQIALLRQFSFHSPLIITILQVSLRYLYHP
jgi:hypothetical protein